MMEGVPPAVSPQLIGAVEPIVVRDTHGLHGSSTRTAGGIHRVDVDAMRVLSAIAIVTIHVTAPFVAFGSGGGQNGPTYWIAEGAGAASRVGVAAFFALAGWAFLVRTPGADDSEFLARRLRRLVVPLLIWNVVYVAQSVLLANLLGRPLWSPKMDVVGWMAQKLSDIAWGPGAKYHLWFMYFLIAAVVVMWLARAIPFRADQIAARRAWFRYSIVTISTLLVFGLSATAQLPLAWAGFSWVIGYAALGVVLLEGPHPPRWVGLVIYLAAAAMTAALGRAIGFDRWPYFNQGPLTVLATIGLFWAVRSISLSPLLASRLQSAAGLTFGIYLAHPLVLDYLRLAIVRDPLVGMPGPLRLVLVWALTIAVTICLVRVWHRSRRLVGWLG